MDKPNIQDAEIMPRFSPRVPESVDDLAVIGDYNIGRDILLYGYGQFPVQLHVNRVGPLEVATDNILGHLSQWLMNFPVDYKPDSPLYIDRNLILFDSRGLIRLGIFHLYSWLPDGPRVPIFITNDPDIKPQVLHAIIFEHPVFKGNYVYQLAELGKIKSGTEFANYESLVDGGVFLANNQKVHSFKNLN